MMGLTLHVPGLPARHLEYLLLDVNGTLTDRGVLLPSVAERLTALNQVFDVLLLTADTYNNIPEVRAALGDIDIERITDGQQKAEVVRRLGPGTCAAIGNGTNDEAMLAAAALGIAVLGPEGTSTRALQAADIVCPSILTALDLLADPRALAATLRP